MRRVRRPVRHHIAERFHLRPGEAQRGGPHPGGCQLGCDPVQQADARGHHEAQRPRPSGEAVDAPGMDRPRLDQGTHEGEGNMEQSVLEKNHDIA